MKGERFVWDEKRNKWVPAAKPAGTTPASLAKLGKAGWPIQSEALAVHPTQVKAMSERCRREGVRTEFNATTGAPILTDKVHRKRYLKMERCHDRNSFNGD